MAQMHPLGATLSAHARGTRTGLQAVEAAGIRVDHGPTQDLYEYISARGFHFPRELVSRYLLALHTRPFTLFTGISGTGKTKLALLVAEYYAQRPGTEATRFEQPADSDHEFFVKLDRVTLRSGTLTPNRDQLDYFNVPADTSEPFTATITNLLGAHGDITFRATNLVAAGRKHLTIQVPSSVRRAFEESGVTERDYLRFEIVEEFKRYRVSLFRPQAETVRVPAEDRYSFVSVRPSWHDHTALLGSWDTTHGRYERTPLLELLLRAGREERDARAAGVSPAPYFVVLDEMNLARIEHYFSDFLSVLESRREDTDGTIRQETLHLHSADAVRQVWTDQHGVEYEIPERLEIPTNVLFTGTLNLDETTHGLSPKVADRAHTISFSTVDFAAFLDGDAAAGSSDPLELPADVAGRLELGALQLSSAADTQAVADGLRPFVALNDLLLEHDQHYGYRVLNDVALYMRCAKDLVGDDPAVADAAVDSAVLQRVLPKFYGWSSDRRGLLGELLVFCVDGPAALRAGDAAHTLERIRVDRADRAWTSSGIDDEVPAFLPRSAGRLARMLRAMG